MSPRGFCSAVAYLSSLQLRVLISDSTDRAPFTLGSLGLNFKVQFVDGSLYQLARPVAYHVEAPVR